MNGTKIEPVHDGENLLHHPAHVAVFRLVQLGEEFHQLVNELEGAGHVFARVAEADLGVGRRVQPREEQAIGQHLREGIGEFLQLELVKHLIAEGFVEAVEPALLELAFRPSRTSSAPANFRRTPLLLPFFCCSSPSPGIVLILNREHGQASSTKAGWADAVLDFPSKSSYYVRCMFATK